MKRSVFVLCKDANTVPCGKHKSHKVSFTNRKIFLLHMFALSNTRSPAVITHKEQLRQSFVNIRLNLFLLCLKKKNGHEALSDM